ncbi:MAG: hydantoinase B/oxoprolinase family protein, partial [Alphaproteobacteria bacterium]|nr:hydantoinase B/oxoprolinase family protein [Alphaproteobacteria bacterium]
MSSERFDPITLELLWTRLISATDEAAAALVRTSFSTLVRESYDFSCIITDESGQSLVQATQSIPSFIGTLPRTVTHFLDVYPIEKLKPGDVLITNDMYQGSGHLPDVNLGKPIFHEGRMIGYAATTAHAPDIGGKIRSPEPREVFEEGLQIPIMKMIDAGAVNDTLVSIIRKNVRTPDQTMGDLWAQVVALDVMEARTIALLKDAGLDNLRDLAAEIHARCEAAMRAAIREVPDGVYRSALDIDGQLDAPAHLEMALTVKGDEIDIDFTGTSPQVDRAINSAMCFTFAQTVYGVKCLLAPNLPNNEGSFRPITIRAPEGCIVNPVFPASGGSRMLTGHFLGGMVLQALGQVLPHRVMASPGSPHWGMNQSGV